MARPPRVVFVVAEDVGGCHYYLAQELRRREIADARVIALGGDVVGAFPFDIGPSVADSDEIRLLVEGADILHFVDLPPLDVDFYGFSVEQFLDGGRARQVIVQIDNRSDLESQRKCIAQAAAGSWPLISTRPNLALFSEVKDKSSRHFMAPFIPWWRGLWRPLTEGTRTRESVRRPGVVFASSRQDLRTRATLEAMVDRAEDLSLARKESELEIGVGRDLRVEVMIARPHTDVLRRRRFAHVFLNERSDHLALSSLEALAQGLDVLAPLEATAAQMYEQLADGKKAPVYPPDFLEPMLEGLQPRVERDRSSVQWARRVLDPKRWLDLYQPGGLESLLEASSSSSKATQLLRISS